MATLLIDLNEYCLLEIFFKNSLTLTDLLSLAETCKLFKLIISHKLPKQWTLERRYAGYQIKLGTDYVKESKNAHGLERIFNNFGWSLTALSLFKYDPYNVMNLVAKYCVPGTLKELNICQVSWSEIPKTLAILLKPIFLQLQTLSISEMNIKNMVNVFMNCDALTELIIRQVPGSRTSFDAILGNYFPKLRRFDFSTNNNQYHDFDQTPFLLSFCIRHKTLKCIVLKNLPALRANFLLKESLSVLNANFFVELGKNCQELEEVEIKFNFRCSSSTTLKDLLPLKGRVLDFSNFQSLKRLRLQLYSLFDIVKLHKLKSLEVLTIHGVFSSDEFLAALPLLQNLRELDVDLFCLREVNEWTSLAQLTKLRVKTSRRVIGDVVNIIKKLNNLEELEIDVRQCLLNENQFYEIVAAVEKRPRVLTLKCKFEFSQDSKSYLKNCDKYSKVKLIKLQ